MFVAALQPGDVIHHRMAGGGGHGDPLEREPEAVARDVLDDKVSVAAARELYGVVVGHDGALDAEATDDLQACRGWRHDRCPARRSSPRPAATASGSCSGSSRRCPRRTRSGRRSPCRARPATTSRSTTRSPTAAPGDVIVLAVGGERRSPTAATSSRSPPASAGVAGIVVDGAIRDRAEIERARGARLPPRHLAARARQERPGRARACRSSSTASPIQPGDLVCADADGIAIVAAADADDVLAAARALEQREREIVAALARGETTVDIFGLKELP